MSELGNCRLCGKKITKRMEKNQQVIKLIVGHSLGGMWDDMGVYYLCSFDCWKKLNLEEVESASSGAERFFDKKFERRLK